MPKMIPVEGDPALTENLAKIAKSLDRIAAALERAHPRPRREYDLADCPPAPEET